MATAGLHCCEPAITGGCKINVATEMLQKNCPTFGHKKKKEKKEEKELLHQRRHQKKYLNSALQGP